jgi:hypothetical protein
MRPRAVVPLLALALATAGCGRDDEPRVEPSSDRDATAASATLPSADPDMKVTVDTQKVDTGSAARP